MKRKKDLLYSYLLLLFIVGILTIGSRTVLAANPQKVTLRPNKTYKSYDITGDKKKDIIRISVNKKEDYYGSLSIKINGRTAYSLKNKYFNTNNVSIKLYTLKNGKPFLYLCPWLNDGDEPVCGVFQYKKGKLIQIINFQTMFKKYGSHLFGDVVSIKGNTISTYYNIMSYTLGPCMVKYNYTYKNGTLKRTSKTTTFSDLACSSKGIFYANKKLIAYTSVKATKRAYSVKSGAAVKVTKCYINKGKMFIQIKYNGKYGWIKPATGFPTNNNKIFSNAGFA